jgi:hypothetical protein
MQLIPYAQAHAEAGIASAQNNAALPVLDLAILGNLKPGGSMATSK